MGVVDLPVAREAATDYPVLVGSSLKGALRDRARNYIDETEGLFGRPERAGDLLVSDGRLVLLPVRCLTGTFRWVSCPHLIERYRRDRLRAGLAVDFDVPTVSNPSDGQRRALGLGEQRIFLEEREFDLIGEPDDKLVGVLGSLILHKEARVRLEERLVILNDDDFAWFCRYGLPVQARNALCLETKQSKSLWYEETLPAESLFYGLVAGRNPEALTELKKLFPEKSPYLQAGGNETVGQGWFAVTVIEAAGGKP